MVELRPLVRAQTLKQMAYDRVKGQLRSGALGDEGIFSANQLADTLGVSRTPVREALMQLAEEGYLVGLGSKGFQVRRFTPKEIDETFEARQAIEVAIVSALATAPQFKIEPLKECLERMTQAAAKNDERRFMNADDEFHQYLVHAKDNDLLAKMLENIHNRILLFGQRALLMHGRMQEVLREHGEIVQGLERRDPVAAGAAMARHLQTTWKAVVKSAAGKNEPGGAD